MIIYRYVAYTTVDVTQTNVKTKSNDDDWNLQRNQQRNLDTLIQTLALRSQPVNIEVMCFEAVPTSVGLGPNLPEVAKIWQVTFDVEHFEAFGKNCELALKDLNYVPIINGLTETVPAFPMVFQTVGTFKNIHVAWA
jgi:hypothetical protein